VEVTKDAVIINDSLKLKRADFGHFIVHSTCHDPQGKRPPLAVLGYVYG
jgi:hypothetical protein